MEQREARIKVIIDTASAQAAVPGAAPSSVPGAPSGPRAVAPDAPGATPGGTPGTSPGTSPGSAPAFAPTVGPGVTPTTAPPYTPGTADTSPTATSESGQSASRRGRASASSAMLSVGKAAVGQGGSLSSAIIDGTISFLGAVPFPLTAQAANALRTVNTVSLKSEKYGPMITGGLSGSLGDSETGRKIARMGESLFGTLREFRAGVDSIGSSVDQSIDLAAGVVNAERIIGAPSEEVREARNRSMRDAFSRRLFVTREMSMMDARKMTAAASRTGEAIGQQASPMLSELQKKLEASMTALVHQ